MTDRELENFYREHLEEDVIFHLSEHKQIPLEDAMDMYYSSRLSECIYEGKYGIQYMDAANLADLLAHQQRGKLDERKYSVN